MSLHCEICGAVDRGGHHCSPRSIARIEARYRREEEAGVDGEEESPTFTERLEVGFEMLSLTETVR